MEATVISHTHWDREWYKTYQQFRLRSITMLDQVLDTLRDNPSFPSFMLDGQISVLEDYLEVRPEREAAVRELAQAGRLLIGPWFIQPDELLVSGEALVRNFQLGARMASRFGKWMPVGYIPDTFGHVSQIPQILQGLGIENAVFRRGLADEPTLLWWQAPDGSRVFTVYLRDGYDNAAWLPADPELFPAYLQRAVDSISPYTQVTHVLLMMGTDHMFIVPELPELLQKARENSDVNAHLGSMPDYIRSVRSQLRGEIPTIHGEQLQSKRHHLLPGVRSNRIWIKQLNAATQTALASYAEPLAAFAGAFGGPLDIALLRPAWHFLLQNQAHDSIYGSGIDEAHADMLPRFNQALQIADSCADTSLRALGRHVSVTSLLQNTAAAAPLPVYDDQSIPLPPAWTISVFNPAGGSSSSPVEVEAPVLPPGFTYRLFDPQGHEIPWELLEQSDLEDEEWDLPAADLPAYLESLQEGFVRQKYVQWSAFSRHGETGEFWHEWGDRETPGNGKLVQRFQKALLRQPLAHFRIHAWAGGALRLRFFAGGVSPFGLHSYLLRRCPGTPPETVIRVAASPVIENEFFQLEAAPDGTLSLLEKSSGRRFSGLNRFVDGGDRGDVFNYSAPAGETLVERPAEPPVISAFKDDTRGQCLEVNLVYHLPRELAKDRLSRSIETAPVQIITQAWLRPGSPRVDISATIENCVKDHRLRVHFPTGIKTDTTFTESPFDLVQRRLALPQNTEGWVEDPVPTQAQGRFILVEEGQAGLVLANRGLPEVEALTAADGRVTLALTLLRCVGWLSRADFPGRCGHAGPALPTPGAQLPGVWSFDYALIPYQDRLAAISQAHSFAAPPLGGCTPSSNGPLSVTQLLLKVDRPEFVVTAVKPAENGRGIVIRGFNTTDSAIVVSLRPAWRIGRAWRVNLLEEPLEEWAVDNNQIRLPVGPKQILSTLIEEK
jgi:hypothetical protein